MVESPRKSAFTRAAEVVQRKLVLGFLATFPLVATFYILSEALKFLDDIIGQYFTREIPGLGLVTLLLFLILIGSLITSYLGRRLFKLSDQLLSQVPIARTIYVSAKQLMEAMDPDGRKAFQSVVLLEYPRLGLYTVGFVTRESPAELRDRIGEPSSTVLLPHTPNVTSGVLLIVPDRALIPLKMTVEEGLKLLLSGGFIVPGEAAPASAAAPLPTPGASAPGPAE